jgi:hypothetical protein
MCNDPVTYRNCFICEQPLCATCYVAQWPAHRCAGCRWSDLPVDDYADVEAQHPVTPSDKAVWRWAALIDDGDTRGEIRRDVAPSYAEKQRLKRKLRRQRLRQRRAAERVRRQQSLPSVIAVDPVADIRNWITQIQALSSMEASSTGSDSQILRDWRLMLRRSAPSTPRLLLPGDATTSTTTPTLRTVSTQT